MADIKLSYGSVQNFDNMPTDNFVQGRLLFANDNTQSYLYFDNGSQYLNIVPRLLSVKNGGTGHVKLNPGEVLIGNDENAILFRAITDNSTLSYVKDNSINLITERTLANWNGAIDEDGQSRISHLGNVLQGVWNATTIAVGKGGTGRTSLTLNGILYGNGDNELNVTDAGIDGQIFTNIEGTPSYITPSLLWNTAQGGSVGPSLDLQISNKIYSAQIPSASEEASGIVNTAAQTFSGEKTFKGAIISQNIYPENTNIYNSGTENNFWSSVNSSSFKIRDNNSSLSGNFYSNLQGETNLLGQTYLDIGNNIAEGQKGNAQGFLNIYSKNNTFAQIISNTDNSNKIITIPNYTGNMTISKAEDINPNLLTSYRLPFFAETYEQLGTNDGYILEVLQGVTNSLGQSKLILGNNIKNGVAGNKYGSIQLYGRDDESFTITPNINTVNEESDITHYTIYLPVSNAATSELLYHDVNTSIGSDSRPVYITKEGKPAPISIQAVSYGGTGRDSLTEGYALIGNKTNPVNFRAITNNTVKTAVSQTDNLITENTLYYYAGNNNISTVGTISSGAWEGSVIQTRYGGTGTSIAPNQGGIIYGATTSSYASTATGSVGQLLQSNGILAPSWIVETIGSNSKPVYVNKGVLTPCQKDFDQYLPLQGGTMLGSVYFNDVIKFSNSSYGPSKPDAGSAGQLYFVEDDGLLVTTNYGYEDPTSGTNGYGTDGALYFKILLED